uniref:Reverse transcriptase domain-containing protein n=1 Tax=Chromera velia CCMP2878 TaxID=1169474 RepID=A0A0G4GJY0_9ALVE|eukprot:Cvel_22235.t1-p1 / transcript=Cvel_22235.t1 / gene=Cvel_22235 / organism=Chromera_velia_CCMP2878 / gene_product=hypothetical protein / transcript_product=hypothetical protein / location=Cvel_scaffold2164:21972-23549(-) / protein_length=526 / sequence_SO=supercontig / SO=protein_coding / is_pseudo=false
MQCRFGKSESSSHSLEHLPDFVLSHSDDSESNVSLRFQGGPPDWPLPPCVPRVPSSCPDAGPRPSARYLSRDRARDAGFPSHIVQALTEGFQFPLNYWPPRIDLENYSSIRDSTYRAEVEGELCRLESLGYIQKVEYKPWLLTPLGLVVKGAKLRIIFDATASGLNSACRVPSFTFPKIRELLAAVPRNGWLWKVDYQDGFFHLPIVSAHVPLLGFRHPYSGEFYVYRALPFGTAVGPYFFQAVAMLSMRALPSSFGRAPKPYLDDTMAAALRRKVSEKKMKVFVAAMEGLHWLVHPKKREGPEQRLDFIGTGIDTVRLRLYIPQKKAKSWLVLLDGVLEGRPTWQEIASLVGKLSFLLSLLREGGIHLRPLWYRLAALERVLSKWRQARGAPAALTRAMRDGLIWWRQPLSNPDYACTSLVPIAGDELGGGLAVWQDACSSFPAAFLDGPGVDVATDASGSGGGIVRASGRGLQGKAYTFPDSLAFDSSNTRELHTAVDAICSLGQGANLHRNENPRLVRVLSRQ